MCGILGTIPATEINEFNVALDKLTHRGPDGFGIWSNLDNDVSLGHRRLSILDISTQGNQPMHYEEFTIIFNGEIYNFLELRKELELHGFIFKSNSDTEVVLIAFKFWKEKCLLKFNGMWSMAIWNNNTKSLFLSRDRFGKKPLFYSFYNGKFIFGSEMKAITPFFSNIYKSEYFDWCNQNIFIYENTENCLIKDIKRFPPASYTYINLDTLDNKEINFIQFWNTIDNLINVPNKYEDQVKIVKEIFYKYFPNFIICYIDEDEALSVKSNFNENGGNNSSTNYKGFDTLFHHQDICNSFCQSFHGRLCEYMNLSNNKKGYGCRYFNH
jgi:asparagine synthase (glutamine-hydrolysing)